MPIFKRGAGPFALHVSMVGVKMGDRLLQVGCDDGRLLATLAGKVGLTGRACGLVADQAAANLVTGAAAKEGVLVEVDVGEVGRTAYDAASFDVVVLHHTIGALSPERRVACLQDAARTLRPGGRCIVIEPAPRGGLGGLIGRKRDTSYVTTGGAERALREEGFAAVRKLAERDGEAFFEAVKPRAAS